MYRGLYFLSRGNLEEHCVVLTFFPIKSYINPAFPAHFFPSKFKEMMIQSFFYENISFHTYTIIYGIVEPTIFYTFAEFLMSLYFQNKLLKKFNFLDTKFYHSSRCKFNIPIVLYFQIVLIKIQ